MSEYDVGDRPRIGNHTTTAAETALGLTPDRLAFKNAAYVDADPAEVTLRVRKPDGTVLVYRWPTPAGGESALVREAAQMGRFYADVPLDQPGLWRYSLGGSDDPQAVSSGELFVRGAV
ncbi:MAG: hypothetical protein ACRDI2_12925 [Chloroflexota bacterium]